MSAALHAVFGQPIAHSQSPRIHAAFGAAEGIAVDYRAIDTLGEVVVVAFAAISVWGLLRALPRRRDSR